MNNEGELEHFLGTDQPEDCRYCGTRTEFEELEDKQLHTCPNCGKKYYVSWEEEDYVCTACGNRQDSCDEEGCQACGSQAVIFVED